MFLIDILFKVMGIKFINTLSGVFLIYSVALVLIGYEAGRALESLGIRWQLNHPTSYVRFQYIKRNKTLLFFHYSHLQFKCFAFKTG